MIELLQMLLSWQGILTLIIALYVVDDVFRLGLKPKVRKMVGRDDIFNKDPEIILIEQEIVRLERLIVQLSNEIAAGSNIPRKPKVEKVSSPFLVSDRVKSIHHGGQEKTWQSWSDQKSS